MSVKIIVTHSHSAETEQKFRNLPNTEIVFAPDKDSIRREDLADAEIFVGSLKPEMAAKMPKLRMIQLFSAGAAGYEWLPEHITLANACGAYGNVIAEHMLTVTLMAMKRTPEYLDMQKNEDWSLLKDIQRIENAKGHVCRHGGDRDSLSAHGTRPRGRMLRCQEDSARQAAVCQNTY